MKHGCIIERRWSTGKLIYNFANELSSRGVRGKKTRSYKQHTLHFINLTEEFAELFLAADKRNYPIVFLDEQFHNSLFNEVLWNVLFSFFDCGWNPEQHLCKGKMWLLVHNASRAGGGGGGGERKKLWPSRCS